MRKVLLEEVDTTESNGWTRYHLRCFVGNNGNGWKTAVIKYDYTGNGAPEVEAWFGAAFWPGVAAKLRERLATMRLECPLLSTTAGRISGTVDGSPIETWDATEASVLHWAQTCSDTPVRP